MLSQSIRRGVQPCRSILLARSRMHQLMSKNGTTFLSHYQLDAAPTGSSEAFNLSNEKLYILDQQRHMGRRDGNTSFNKERKPNRKKKKQYHKRMRELYHHKVGRHSAPGSKAVLRRQIAEDEQRTLIDEALGKVDEDVDQVEYNFADAIVDDLLGNSSFLSATPTPRPVFIGKQYDKHFTQVSGMMEDFHSHLKLAESMKDSESNALAPPLPNDKQLSLLIRSYRDKHSRRHKPMGIVKVLRHLLTEIRLPTSIFGEKTYAALMSCSASPTEARRIIQMMKDNGLSPDVYIYSILIDVYAKSGDFRGADEVLSEMQFEGIEPGLPAYTSLLAGCYKVVNTGSMPQKIKAEAGSLAWERWKESIINGLKPDVMMYGSMIRIFAARGFPEKAINLIEEMQINEIRPTTLIFSSALKAVARSHANTLRFQGGYSEKNKRREKVAAHHGKMAKTIVVLAEQAGVEQDDGFVSSLMLCAGTAGDAASAKAIYLASEVRKLEYMRTIGGPEHLDMIRGKDPRKNDQTIDSLSTGMDQLELTDGSDETTDSRTDVNLQEQSAHESQILSYNPKKKRRDSRKLNALMTANANAVEKRGLAKIWSGSENKGFLCESSLRMIQLRYVPKYVDKSIPGMSSTEAGLSGMVWDDEDVETVGKQLRRKKFQGLIEDQVDNTIDDLDPELYNLFVEDEDILFEGEKKEREEEDDDEIEDDSAEQTFTFENGVMTEDNQSKSKDNIDVESKTLEEPKDQTFTLKNSEILGNDALEGNLEHGAGKIDDAMLEKMLDGDEFEDELLDDILSSEGMSDEDKALFNEMMSELDNLKDINPEEAANMTDNELEQLLARESSSTSEIIDVSPQVVDNIGGEVAIPDEADDLDMVLYGLPESRINLVRDSFQKNLGAPSMIQLVPMLRETMPEIITRNWLVEKNVRDATVVMEMAKEEKLVDSYLMNSMLQVYANSKKADEALRLYEDFEAEKKV